MTIQTVIIPVAILAVLVVARKLTTAKISPPQTAKPNEQAVLVFMRLSDGGMGNTEDFKQLSALEDKLGNKLRDLNLGEDDGNEVGDGFFEIFLYGPDADKIFDAIKPLIQTLPPRQGSYAIKRYGAPGAKQAKVELTPPTTGPKK